MPDGLWPRVDDGPAHTGRATTDRRPGRPGIEVLSVPGRASWVNPIEPAFGIATRRVLRYGWSTTGDDGDPAVQERVEERGRIRRPVRSTWQPAACPRTPRADR